MPVMQCGVRHRAPVRMHTAGKKDIDRMSLPPHDFPHLVHELPEFRERIRVLQAEDAHFARLYERYLDVSRELHGLGQDGEPLTGQAAVLASRRVHLKGVLYEMLRGD